MRRFSCIYVLIPSTDVDYENDFIEIVIELIKETDKTKLLSTTVRLNELVKGKQKEDLWTLSNNSLVNIKYFIYEENKESDVGSVSNLDPQIAFRRETRPFSLTENVKTLPNVKKPSEIPMILKKISFNITTDSRKNSVTTLSLFNQNSNSESTRTDKDKISCAVILTDTNKNTNNSISLQNASTTIVPSNNAIKLESEEISLDDSELFEHDSFADLFFIAGIPKKNAKVITDSKYFTAPCKHKDCSVLHAYRTDVLYRFPSSNYKGINLCSSVSMCYNT
jgi:hypothetical protein